MDYHGFRRVAPHLEKNAEACHDKKMERKKHQKVLLDAIDRSNLKVSDNHELHLLLQLLMHTVFTTIADGYRRILIDGSYDIEQINQNFESKISWLKNGARKEKTE
jgi:hypothetical protein